MDGLKPLKDRLEGIPVQEWKVAMRSPVNPCIVVWYTADCGISIVQTTYYPGPAIENEDPYIIYELFVGEIDVARFPKRNICKSWVQRLFERIEPS